MKKFKKVEVNTPKGKRFLVFKAIPENLEGFACDVVCPIGKTKCLALRNPLYPDDPEQCFIDFCSTLGCENEKGEITQDDKELASYVPAEGTVEENLYDIGNVYQTLIEKNGYVRISDVIDNCCQDCPMYNKEHSLCSPDNNMCLLQDLFRNINYNPSIIKNE